MQQTGHPGSRATSYVVHGNQVSAATFPNATKVDHWYQIAGVDVDGGGCSFYRGVRRFDHGWSRVDDKWKQSLDG